MKPETPSDIQVITEMDIYEATIRKATDKPFKEFSWDDVEAKSNAVITAEEPKATEEPKVAEESKAAEEPKATEEPKADEEERARKELIDKLMADIMRPHTLTPVKEDESIYDDMPALVYDSEEEEKGQQWPVSEDREWMLALYKKPSCPRCEAALKVLMSVSDQEVQSDESEESETSEEPDDSDSDYVPSETCSDSSSDSDVEIVTTVRHRTMNIPPSITYTFILLVVLYIIKLWILISEMKPRRYS